MMSGFMLGQEVHVVGVTEHYATHDSPHRHEPNPRRGRFLASNGAMVALTIDGCVHYYPRDRVFVKPEEALGLSRVLVADLERADTRGAEESRHGA